MLDTATTILSWAISIGLMALFALGFIVVKFPLRRRPPFRKGPPK